MTAMFRPRALLAIGISLLLWIGAFVWLYDGHPTDRSWAVGVLPALLAAIAVLLKGWDPGPATAAALALAVGGAAWLGAAWLRDQQEVDPAALSRISLDRGANPEDMAGNNPDPRLAPGGMKPRSGLRYQMVDGRRTIQLVGQVLNRNDFALWQVDLEILFYRDGRLALTVPLSLDADLPAGGSAPIAWAHAYRAEELPPEPAWDCRILAARRHFGGVPRRAGN